ncbi:MAG: alanine--glyoxylate aminotransferase family protein [Ignavibacteria bacterium]|nr:alanine--glyoxylate aminotransferase family protein [Ignavibacteria bacterium]
MRKIYFTTGPTELNPEIKSFIAEAIENDICSINHRSVEFVDICKDTVKSLKALLNIPDNYHVFFLASATECMDKIITNCVETSSLHFVNGAFAERFYKIALELNKKAQNIEIPYGESFKFKKLKLKEAPELICITHNETSTGVTIDSNEIYKLKKGFPETLIAVDIVTSVPYYNLNFSKFDCAFFSVQKGFGLPPGLAILIVNDKCIEKVQYLKNNKINIGSYHNFISLYENSLKNQTTETPNTLGIFLLGKVCEYLINYNIELVRQETEVKSEMIYNFFEMSDLGTPFIRNVKDRSKTVIVIDLNEKQNEIIKLLEENGIIVSTGYRNYKNTQIRIANFPQHKTEDVKRMLEILSTVK